MIKVVHILAFVLLIASCNNSLVTVPEFEPIASERVVLLEEMTGVSCPNCPKGTAEIDAIKALYGQQVIPIAIHGIFLSWPTSESKYDLRNDFSRSLEANLASGTSKPAALINRINVEGTDSKVFNSPDLWAGHIESQLRIAPLLNIELELSYEPGNRLMVVDAGITANTDILKALNISVMVLENNIIDAQEDLTEIIEDFEHKHVLRTMLTPYDGELFVNSVEENAFESRSYSFVLPADENLWKEQDIEVVVFIHEHEGNGEVLQAAVKKLF